MLAYAVLAYAGVCWRVLACADVCWYKSSNTDAARSITGFLDAARYADVCWRMLAYAGPIIKKLTYPPRITGVLETFAIDSQLFLILTVFFVAARFFFLPHRLP